jgi:hypothetical protein
MALQSIGMAPMVWSRAQGLGFFAKAGKVHCRRFATMGKTQGSGITMEIPFLCLNEFCTPTIASCPPIRMQPVPAGIAHAGAARASTTNMRRNTGPHISAHRGSGMGSPKGPTICGSHPNCKRITGRKEARKSKQKTTRKREKEEETDRGVTPRQNQKREKKAKG